MAEATEEADLTPVRAASPENMACLLPNSALSTPDSATLCCESPQDAKPIQVFDYEPMFPDNVRPSVHHASIMTCQLSVSQCDLYPPYPAKSLFGWTRYVHPTGSLYYYNRHWRTIVQGDGPVTAGDWRDGSDPGNMMSPRGILAMQVIKDLWSTKLSLRPNISDCELFIRLPAPNDPPSTTTTAYYFVDWQDCNVFWLQSVTIPTPVASMAHASDVFKLWFWTHVDHFPMHHSLPVGARDELEALLNFQAVDDATNRLSTAPYNATTSHMLSECIRPESVNAPPISVDSSNPTADDMRSSLTKLEQSSLEIRIGHNHVIVLSAIDGNRNATVARLWRQIWNQRCINFFGDRFARTFRNEQRPSVCAKTDCSPPLVVRQILSIMMFNYPAYFYELLADVFVDEVLYQRGWTAFADTVGRFQWMNSILAATVLFAANVAFIVMAADQENNPAWFFVFKALSLSSVVFAMGTIITSTLLVQVSPWLKSLSAKDANEYLVRRSRWPLGLFGMSMFLGMSPFMLTLSLFTFLGATLGYGLEHWTLNHYLPLLLAISIPVVALCLSQSLYLNCSWNCTSRRHGMAKDVEMQN